MSIACSIPRATDTHSEYVIIVAVLLPQCLHERSSMLRYTYIACHVKHYGRHYVLKWLTRGSL
jgi:hypothetical protein